MADQHFWGARCRALGIGDTIPFSKLDANRLARGLRRVLEADVRARATTVGQQIANEDGVAVASAYVEQIDPSGE
jgi:UDP:flavonoid glycosyltransferase YjiC (YdhE family)